jgi:DNA-binding NarL/FixJ family response regulator
VKSRLSKVRSSSPSAKDSVSDRRAQLTRRQLEIALLVADGLSTGEIATRLHVSTKTVEYHRIKIHQTIGVKKSALLVRYLIREGLLKP